MKKSDALETVLAFLFGFFLVAVAIVYVILAIKMLEDDPYTCRETTASGVTVIECS